MFFLDLPTTDVLNSIDNMDSNKFNYEEIVTKDTTINDDQIIYDNFSINDEHLIQNNLLLNSELFQDQQMVNDLSEPPLKINSRPQRQAAKKAENQIRVN